MKKITFRGAASKFLKDVFSAPINANKEGDNFISQEYELLDLMASISDAFTKACTRGLAILQVFDNWRLEQEEVVSELKKCELEEYKEQIKNLKSIYANLFSKRDKFYSLNDNSIMGTSIPYEYLIDTIEDTLPSLEKTLLYATERLKLEIVKGFNLVDMEVKISVNRVTFSEFFEDHTDTKNRIKEKFL